MSVFSVFHRNFPGHSGGGVAGGGGNHKVPTSVSGGGHGHVGMCSHLIVFKLVVPCPFVSLVPCPFKSCGGSFFLLSRLPHVVVVNMSVCMPSFTFDRDAASFVGASSGSRSSMGSQSCRRSGRLAKNLKRGKQHRSLAAAALDTQLAQTPRMPEVAQEVARSGVRTGLKFINNFVDLGDKVTNAPITRGGTVDLQAVWNDV